MKTPFIAVGLALFAVSAHPIFAQPAKQEPIERIGEIIIVGNTVTRDRVIREVLDFYPGQVLDRRRLVDAERALARLGLFKVDAAQKIRPTVQVLESPGPFKDILVKVEETSTRRWRLERGFNAVGQPIVRLLLEDRNFDPLGFPPSWHDLVNERAFRGGGQHARIEVGRLNLMHMGIELFADGSLLPVVVRSVFADWR